MKNIKSLISKIIIVVVVIILLVTLKNSFQSVPTGYVGIKTRFGKVSEDVIQEGLNLKIPYIEKIVLMDCRTQKAEIATSTASKDLQEVSLKIAVNYNVSKSTAHELYRQVGINYESIIISPAILESVKSVTAQYTAEELITKRAEVSNKMEETLKEKIESRGFDVVDFNITDLDFSAAYNQAIEKKQVAEQEAKQAEYELQKAKINNEKKIAEAEANAKVMQIQDATTTENALKLKEIEIQKAAIEKWNGVLPSTMSGDTAIPFLNIN
jgi:regulator of protease activity HflC (stomatin/prohibitin superfamily)